MEFYASMFFALLLTSVARTEDRTGSPNPGEAADYTIKLLKTGNAVIELDPSQTEFIMVLGNTGAGKSTVTNYLAGNSSDMLGVQGSPDTRQQSSASGRRRRRPKNRRQGGSFKIVDARGTIGARSTVSTSIFPERIIDIDAALTRDRVFYDCPGYSDTRNTSVEIANTYFIKKVADHARRLKLLLVVSHFDVMDGGDRRNFLEMVKQTLNIISDISKFKSSIALAVTKVNLPDEPTEDIVEEIAKFLENVIDDLPANGWTGNALSNAQELIEALLTTDEPDGPLTRIGILRQPQQPGPLSDMPKMEECKVALKNMIRGMQYVNTVPADFGYTLSSNAIHDIQKIATVIGTEVTRSISSLSDILKSQFLARLNSLKGVADFNGLKNDISRLSKMTKYVDGKDKLKPFIEEMRETLGAVSRDMKPITAILQQMSDFAGVLEFLQIPIQDEIQINTGPWCKSLEALDLELQNLTADPRLEFLQGGSISVAKGTYIVLSDILRQMKHPKTKSHTLVILALHTLIIDTDVVATDLSDASLSVVIISPKWTFTGSRSFNLNGRPGQSYGFKALTGQLGAPGLPGENGGNFWGVADEVTGELPRVSVEGGRGGPGQNGGDGHVGIRGRDADTCQISGSYRDWWIFGSTEYELHVSKSDFGHAGGKCWGYNVACTFYCYGETGHNGQPGRGGGVGGKTGNSGTIHLYSVSNISALPISITGKYSSLGITGFGGAGGSGGAAGANGYDYKYVRTYAGGFISGTYEYQDRPAVPRASAGSLGPSNYNSLYIKDPAPLQLLPVQDYLQMYNSLISSTSSRADYFMHNLISAGSKICQSGCIWSSVKIARSIISSA